MTTPENIIIIYNTLDGKAAMALYAKTRKYGSTKSAGGTFCHLCIQYQYTHIQHVGKKRVGQGFSYLFFLITAFGGKSFSNAHEGNVKRKNIN